MTDGDRPAFAQAFAGLVVALREKQPDVVTIAVYFDSLKDLEIEWVCRAAEWLRAHAAYFPKTTEWRAAARKIEAERIEQQRAFLRKLPTPLCRDCDDTGWAHAADGGVRRCPCREARRRELLGRQPWPALTAGREAHDCG